MSRAELWRTDFDMSSLDAIMGGASEGKALTKEEFSALREQIAKEVPEGDSRKSALKRIKKLNPDGPYGSEIVERREPAPKAGRAVDLPAYQMALADELKTLACSGDENAAYALRGFITNDRILNTGKQAARLVDDILKPDCPVSSELTEQDRAALKKLANGAQASESKQ